MTANADMARYWNAEGGANWVEHQDHLDRELAPFVAPLLVAADVSTGDHVLDVGCGAGATTLAVADAVGAEGRVMGFDLSRPLLDRLQARARAAGLGNVIVRAGDAQVAQLPPAHFDALVSRFGVMFFDDPVAAFTNLAGALKPQGRMAFVCWQAMSANRWYADPLAAVVEVVPPPAPSPPGGPGPFAFADPERPRSVLAASGWTGVAVEALEVELDCGPLADAVGFAVHSTMVQRLLDAAPPGAEAAAAAAVSGALERYVGADGHVRADGAAWLVTARRP